MVIHFLRVLECSVYLVKLPFRWLHFIDFVCILKRFLKTRKEIVTFYLFAIEIEVSDKQTPILDPARRGTRNNL